jgi:hypothetical protein
MKFPKFATRVDAWAAGWREVNPAADEPIYDLHDHTAPTLSHWVNPDGYNTEPVFIENERNTMDRKGAYVEMYPPKGGENDGHDS